MPDKLLAFKTKLDDRNIYSNVLLVKLLCCVDVRFTSCLYPETDGLHTERVHCCTSLCLYPCFNVVAVTTVTLVLDSYLFYARDTVHTRSIWVHKACKQ